MKQIYNIYKEEDRQITMKNFFDGNYNLQDLSECNKVFQTEDEVEAMNMFDKLNDEESDYRIRGNIVYVAGFWLEVERIDDDGDPIDGMLLDMTSF